jgi:probable rRNA maturation factor
MEIVGEGRMRTLNYAARGVDEATDVLAFPIDPPITGGSSASPTEPPRIIDQGPRELGDVFICPEKATDEVEAAVHGALHLCGYDHETDDGEMLELQAKVLGSL